MSNGAALNKSDIDYFPGDQVDDWSRYLNAEISTDQLVNLFGGVDPSSPCIPFDKPPRKSRRLTVVKAAERRPPADTYDAIQHLLAIHEPKAERRFGYIYYGRKHTDGRYAQWQGSVNDIELGVKGAFHRGDEDIYASINTFRATSRTIPDLVALNATFADLDYRKTAIGHRRAAAVANNVIWHLEQNRKPLPSMILSTGMGLLAMWLHNSVGKEALPVWNAFQREVLDLLKDFGADDQAIDASRVFRLPGSKNTKAFGTDHDAVEIIWGNHKDFTRYQFRDLMDRMLPHTQAEVKSFHAERAKRVAAKKLTTKKPNKLSPRTLAQTRLEDLDRLIAYRYGDDGKIPSGQRNVFMFLKSCQHAYLTDPDSIKTIIVEEARNVASWSPSAAKGCVSSSTKRARRAASGEVETWRGNPVDPRYGYSTKKMIALLGITKEEMKAAGLRTLCDKDQLAENKRLDNKELRISLGQKTDHDQQRAARSRLRDQAMQLKETGLSLRKIASELKVSYSLLHKAMNEKSSS